MKKIRLLPVLIGIILLCSAAVATWLVFDNSSFVAYVRGKPVSPVMFSVDFENKVLNTSIGSDYYNTEAIISNYGDYLNLEMGISVIRVDIQDACTDYINDCSVGLTYINQEISDGDTVIVPPGESAIVSRVYCRAGSCPQNIMVSANFSLPD